MKQIVNPGVPLSKRCLKCGERFYSALRNRVKCVVCKPETQEELDKLMNYPGAHVVLDTGSARQLIA